MAAKLLGRKFIGIERESEYRRIARERLDAIPDVVDPDLFDTPAKRREQRIPFGWVVERGLLRPGDILFDPGKRWTAKVRADGSIISAQHRGSIHQVGAAVQGAPSCNGWTFWMTDRYGAPAPIDLLRQRLRAELGGGR